MKRRFVIAVDGLSRTQESLVKNYLRSIGPWWHWIPNFWLLTSSKDDVNCKELRDTIIEFAPGKRVLVMEISEHRTWAGNGPKTTGKNMFDWLKNVWKPNDDRKPSDE